VTAAWWLVAKTLRRRPTSGPAVRAYDRWVVPVLRRIEPQWAPVGQSIFAVFRRPSADL
jgi:hypothetical protein